VSSPLAVLSNEIVLIDPFRLVESFSSLYNPRAESISPIPL
jgi:hypothetical protein